jgi:hypothetical protein
MKAAEIVRREKIGFIIESGAFHTSTGPSSFALPPVIRATLPKFL